MIYSKYSNAYDQMKCPLQTETFLDLHATHKSQKSTNVAITKKCQQQK